MSRGSLIDSPSFSKAANLSSIFPFSSLKIPTNFLTSLFWFWFSLSPFSFFRFQLFSRLSIRTLFARKLQIDTVSFELFSWRSSFSMDSPLVTLARRSRHIWMAFLSLADTVILGYFLRVSQFEILGTLFDSLQPYTGVRQRFLTSSVMIEVKVFFLEKGFPVTGLTSSSALSPKLKENSSSHPIRLNWSLTSILLSSSSALREMVTLEGKTTDASSMREISLAMVLSSKGQNPKSISQRTTPRDQISAFMVQISPLRISGAMQMGDPSMV